MPESLDAVVARLRRQVSQALPILFVGAGFSLDALNRAGGRLPTAKDLTKEFWRIAFPDRPFEDETKLGDAYYAAKASAPKKLLALLRSVLSVDPATLPGFYRVWFSIPWFRCYTLNIDDLEVAVLDAFSLDRHIHSLSGTSNTAGTENKPGSLHVVHLNGALWDDLDEMTFSDPDYAARATRPDLWYDVWSSEILSRPVVFVGTELNESPLWQYVEFRKHRGGKALKELRPGSCLVSPTLNPARQLVLNELNIDWIPMAARDFAEQVLSDLNAEALEGQRLIQARSSADERRRHPHLVADLATDPSPASPEFLLGQEPTWPDIKEGLAVERSCDSHIYELASAVLTSTELSPPLVISGTAGSGKSTSIMRLGLRIAADGIPVYWLDEKSNIEPHGLRELVADTLGPLAILIDDSDLFGRTTSTWARDLPKLRPQVLLAFAVRSTKVDGLLDAETLGLQPLEASMPHLTDEDIDGLLDVLDRHNRLGVLKGRPREEQAAAFRKEAGRQLLVAMIQATSGKKLREKVYEEFQDLSDDKRFLYALVALVHSQRYTLDRDEILIASGRSSNEVLNDLEQLAQRHIIVRDDLYSNYRARHRMIADELVTGMGLRPYVGEVLQGICFAFATRVRPDLARTARPWRRLIRFINHQYLIQITTVTVAREVYAHLEDILTWDYHYWLQRGSLEVEEGDLELATNFLGQARSLAPGDRSVETEWAYLLTKKAARAPNHPSAREWFEEGRETLEDLIQTHGRTDPYPYHVLGSQGLAWARHAALSEVEKRALLAKLLEHLREGLRHHSRADDLRALSKDVEEQWLMTAVRKE